MLNDYLGKKIFEQISKHLDDNEEIFAFQNIENRNIEDLWYFWIFTICAILIYYSFFWALMGNPFLIYIILIGTIFFVFNYIQGRFFVSGSRYATKPKYTSKMIFITNKRLIIYDWQSDQVFVNVLRKDIKKIEIIKPIKSPKEFTLRLTYFNGTEIINRKHLCIEYECAFNRDFKKWTEEDFYTNSMDIKNANNESQKNRKSHTDVLGTLRDIIKEKKSPKQSNSFNNKEMQTVIYESSLISEIAEYATHINDDNESESVIEDLRRIKINSIPEINKIEIVDDEVMISEQKTMSQSTPKTTEEKTNVNQFDKKNDQIQINDVIPTSKEKKTGIEYVEIIENE